MLTRLRDSVTHAWNSVKETGSDIKKAGVRGNAKKVWYALPGIALIVSRAGGAAFNGLRSAKRFLNVEDGSKTELGLVLASVNVVSNVGVNIVTRFFNLYRRENKKKPASAPRTKPVKKGTLLAQFDESKGIGPHHPDHHYEPPKSPLIRGGADSPPLTPESEIEEKIFGYDFEGQEPENPKPCFCSSVYESCFYPNVEVPTWSVNHAISKLIANYYSGGSAMSAILNMSSLIQLLQLWFTFEYTSECGDEESPIGAIVAVNVAVLYLMYSNLKSFYSYNNPAIHDDYYPKLFIETHLFTEDGKLFAEYENQLSPEGNLIPRTVPLQNSSLFSEEGKLYRRIDAQNKERILSSAEELKTQDGRTLTLRNGLWEISYLNHLESLIGVTLNSIQIFYSNQKGNLFIANNILCHLFGAIDFSDTISKIFAAAGAGANFYVTLLMTLGPRLHNQREEQKEEKRLGIQGKTRPPVGWKDRLARFCGFEKQKESEAEFGRALYLIDLCILGNGLNAAQGTYVSVTDLPKAIAERGDLTYHPAMIALGCFTALLGLRSSVILDRESTRREANTRIRIREEQADDENSDSRSLLSATCPQDDEDLTEEDEKADSRPNRYGFFNCFPRQQQQRPVPLLEIRSDSPASSRLSPEVESPRSDAESVLSQEEVNDSPRVPV